MTNTQTQRRRIFKSGLTMLLVGATLGITGYVSAPAGAAGNDHQITICHATSSGSNPYSTPNPAKWQISAPEGHDGHPGDIIPPFPTGSKGSHTWAQYDGKNWNTDGQAIYYAGCNVAPPPAGTITLDKVTAGDGQPAGTTAFTFSVECSTELGTVVNAAPSISPDDSAATVASGLGQGDSCTITETNAAGAAATSSVVGGGSEQAGSVAVVNIASADQAVSVVFTNTYRCAEGTTSDGVVGCTTTTVTDACPTVDGIQASVAECPTVVEDNTVTPTPTPTASAVQVEGIQLATTPVAGTQVAAAELPRTGTNTLPLAELGLGLILLGAGALIFGREQTATV